MDSNEKFNLIIDGLDEIIGEQELINIIQERDLKLYWGTAPTGKPHIGYLKPLFKICQFLKNITAYIFYLWSDSCPINIHNF